MKIENIESYKKNINEFNLQFKESAFTYSGKISHKNKIDGIVIIGMGGSGLAGEILYGISEECGITLPIIYWKNYGIPKTGFKSPMFIFVSFSGNTEETISGLNSIINKKHTVAVVSTGGKIKEIAVKNKIPLISFDAKNLTPREAIGYNVFAVISLISRFAKLKHKYGIKPEFLSKSFEKQGEKIAKLAKNKTVLIYTSEEEKHIGRVWKININETGKMPAFNNTIPEAIHNEIESLANDKKSIFVLLISPNKNKRVQNKMEFLNKALKSKNISTLYIDLKNKNQIQHTWKNVVLSHFASLFISKIKNINPSKTPFIESIKANKKQK